MESTHKKYTCPMHPEVLSDQAGRCPKCGMALVVQGQESHAAHTNDHGLGAISWRSYLPLIVIIALITLCSLIVSWDGGISLRDFLISFMTGFFLVFSAFKLMDLKGFKEGYSTYDLLARKFPVYGYVYPFIELGFGLSMLASFHPDWLLWAEVGVMIFSGLGVAIKLARREPFMCACLGTFLKVPLTYVTLIEDFGMAAAALLLILL